MAWNHLGFLLDDIFFPNWRSQQITTPIFIVGNARSGTTWLHRLLTSIFEKQFTTVHTWEILFATSVTWRLLFHEIYFLDQCIGSPLFALILLLESLLISKSSLHEIGLQMAEEDEWLMIHISKAQLMCFFFPCGGEVLAPLISFDTLSSADEHLLSSAAKTELFQYYRECIQRHLYAQAIFTGTRVTQNSSAQRIFVSKNPSFTLRIRTLFQIFPDCKVICLLRDPADSVPSMVSYLAAVFHLFSSPRHKYPNTETLVSYCVSHYLYPLGLSSFLSLP
jgi:omega-hydroxy-beta-dihydromenaquinone-9 sulfotransferase